MFLSVGRHQVKSYLETVNGNYTVDVVQKLASFLIQNPAV